MTTVVNIYANKHYDVYIGRRGRHQDGYFGNPFPILDQHTTRQRSLARYKAYFDNRIETDPEFVKRVLELKDKKLGCFCKPAECHGDIIANWLDK